MKRVLVSIVVVAASLLLLNGCGDPEAAARAKYNEGMSLQRDGRVDEAVSVYKNLVEKYPQTEIAVEVNKALLALGAIDAISSEIGADIDRKKIEKTQADLGALESALNLYRLDNFEYPTENQGLTALIQRPRINPAPRNYRTGGYMDILPRDAWGAAYQYRNPGEHGEIDIFSVMPDGITIGNWNRDQF